MSTNIDVLYLVPCPTCEKTLSVLDLPENQDHVGRADVAIRGLQVESRRCIIVAIPEEAVAKAKPWAFFFSNNAQGADVYLPSPSQSAISFIFAFAKHQDHPQDPALMVRDASEDGILILDPTNKHESEEDKGEMIRRTIRYIHKASQLKAATTLMFVTRKGPPRTRAFSRQRKSRLLKRCLKALWKTTGGTRARSLVEALSAKSVNSEA